MTKANSEDVKEVKETNVKKTSGTKKVGAKKSSTKSTQDDVIANLQKQIEMLQKALERQVVTKSDDVVAEKIEVEKPKKKTSFQDIRNEEVEVKRMLCGMGAVLYIDKKTGDEYCWEEVDDVEYVTVDVLKRMNASSPKFLKAPWLVIQDNDIAVEVLGLKPLYENIKKTKNVHELLELDDNEILCIIDSVGRQFRDILASNIQTMIHSEELTSYKDINRLKLLLGKDFDM